MQPYKIIVGFADIKLQLIQRWELKEEPNEIGLWFSIEDGILYAHKSDDHQKYMVVALRKAKTWRCYLAGGGFARSLFNHGVQLSHQKNEAVDKILNNLFREFGSHSAWGLRPR